MRKILTSVWNFIKNFFTKHIGLKIIALLAAILLWAYVLSNENPYRVKYVSNVNVSFEGEAELLAKGLCVRGDRSEILEKVTVAVKTQMTNYTSLGTQQITATVSLRNISEARTYDLPVAATVTSGYGTVQSITPGSITVEIDTLVQKTIPITAVYTGTLPEGYWADMDAASVTSRIDIEGPKTDIARVRRAECEIDLSNCTSLLYSTFDLVMYDENDEIVDDSVIIGTIPSATVRLPIYPEKYVEVDISTALTGTDTLVERNYELRSVESSPETVRIVGESAALAGVNTLSVAPVDVSAQTEFKTYTTTLILPEGIRLPDANNSVTLSVDVKEVTDEAVFDTIPLKTVGLGENLTAELSLQTVSVNVEGSYSAVNALSRGSFTVSVDLTDLTAGEYDIPIEITFANADTASLVRYFLTDAEGNTVTAVHIVLTEP